MYEDECAYLIFGLPHTHQADIFFALSMAAISSLSLVLPSHNPKTLTLTVPKLALLSLPSSSSLSSRTVPVLASHAFLALTGAPVPPRSRFVRGVFVSSDLEDEEDVLRDEAKGSFSRDRDLKLFVGNLPFSVDSSKLAGLFGRAGNVEMVEVIYDKITGRSRGFGFVTMSTAEEVEAAAEKFNGYELDGRPLMVNSGPPPPKRETRMPRMGRGGSTSSNRVYVGNLSWGVDDSALETLFSEQGNVVDAKVVYDRDSGRSRGFGFVTYSSAEEVDSAIETLNGADLHGRQIRVTVAEAKPRRQF
ncbi:hypothetical protein SAY86_027615 [Trapa natans]|uniref:RRM domain-containing protein n=1 Tax=Trapa natans TaxID=22666 RepID=A0AAN7KTD8_TRANT|nr:hypothetical protein SAY86_027615 [Trapa natans]